MNIQTSLYDTYGGMAKISRMVLAHYDKVMDSPVLAPFFAQTDMRALVEHQSHFLATVMGGPASFSDEELRVVHAGLAIDARAFECMLALLRETLLEFGFAEEHAEFVIQSYEARRGAIVSC